jgi:GAF domain-containing protein
MKAEIPKDEAQRLTALREYRVLDTESEQAYDDLTQLAATVCHVPSAFVSLVDEARQWFKSRVGFEPTETARDISFCAHAILKPEPLIVPDALKDSRFADNELVTKPPHIRFYAGFPLVTPEGFALGALCAVDTRPRQLGQAQMKSMVALSRQIMTLLELRRISSRLADALERIKTLHGLLPMCAWCKKVRGDEGYWTQVEVYIQVNTEASVTSSICPECLEAVRTEELKQP